jgi:OHCU decarboxylase
MNQLERLNSLPANQAQAEFLKCCGSTRWAREMTAARSFANADELLERGDAVWQSLSPQDWLDAFHAHPKIGEQKAADTQSEQAQNWSAQEQSGVQSASASTAAALAAANREYEQRFGFIFIVCATGKTSDEMLAILTERLRNDAQTELNNAAEEQRKIMRLRLLKSLESGA